MRFFSGVRDTKDKSKAKASQVYKDRMEARAKGLPDPDPNEVYKKAIEERMAKMMDEYVLGLKKNGTTIPGAKSPDDSAPREIPKTTQMMLKMLAMKREAKARKEKKQREMKIKSEMKQKKWEEDQKRWEEERQAALKKEQEYLAAQDPDRGWW